MRVIARRIHTPPLSPPLVVPRRSLTRIVIQRNLQPLYVERGWRLKRGWQLKLGKALHGYYRTRYQSVAGYITNPFGTRPEYFIVKPPDALLQGSHGACFMEQKRGKYYVHWNKQPQDINSGILFIEHCLLEALRP